MSSESSKEDKQFDPTPLRLKKAREEGNFARSREVQTAAMVSAGAIGLWFSGGDIMHTLSTNMREVFHRFPEAQNDPYVYAELLAISTTKMGTAMAPLLGMVMVAAILSSISQTGLVLLPNLLAPKADRLNPIKQVKNVFGPGPAAVRMGVAILKTAVVGFAVGIVSQDQFARVMDAQFQNLGLTMLAVADAVIRIMLAAGLALIIVALIDYSYQRARWTSQLKMTREEIKQENKEQEGSPEIKGKRKGMYRELTMNRIMQEVPLADVIVTNPTHFAVAIRYDSDADGAPRVVAKGLDAMALVIRRVARQNSVPIVENRPLARSLHREVKVGRPIPETFYQAVAEVLAYVYRIRREALG